VISTKILLLFNKQFSLYNFCIALFKKTFYKKTTRDRRQTCKHECKNPNFFSPLLHSKRLATFGYSRNEYCCYCCFHCCRCCDYHYHCLYVTQNRCIHLLDERIQKYLNLINNKRTTKNKMYASPCTSNKKSNPILMPRNKILALNKPDVELYFAKEILCSTIL